MQKRRILTIICIALVTPFFASANLVAVSPNKLCVSVTADTGVLQNPSPWAGYIPYNQTYGFIINPGSYTDCPGVLNDFQAPKNPINGEYIWNNPNTLQQTKVNVFNGKFYLGQPPLIDPDSVFSSTTSVLLITTGVTDVGTGLLVILLTAIALIIGVFIFKRGIHLLKASGRGGTNYIG